jgi:hypothetical protein
MENCILIHDAWDLIDSTRVHIETYPDESIWDELPSELLPPREEWELGETIVFRSRAKATEYARLHVNCSQFKVVSLSGFIGNS